MNGNFELNEYCSERTLSLVSERDELKETFYGRVNKNKKARALFVKNMQIYTSTVWDLFISSFRNPVTLVLLFTTVFLGTYNLVNTIYDNKFEYKFFQSLEKDSNIPKELLVRVQRHYYNTK